MRRLRDPAPSDHGYPTAAGHLHHAPRQKPQALVATVFHRLLAEELVAQAHPQDRLAVARQLHDPAAQAGVEEPGEGRRERADARQHDPVGRVQLVRIRGQSDLGTHVDQRALDGANVAHAVVDDRDQPSRPFDEGTPGAPPAAIAARSASPRALNVDSATWCRLRPRIRSTWIVAPRWMERARQNSSITSDSRVPTRPRSATLYDRNGRRPRSTTTRASDSSSGA